MNAERRKNLEKVEALIGEARTLLEDIKSEEEDAYGNLPESLQNTERGEKMDEAISEMDDIIDTLEDAEGRLYDIRN